ncbi:MAG: phosphatidylserine decarboxylase family protein [Verrucomicrobia bacterium]|nr:phosphatidylserine decarboxylase family protein [Verrucomicrobiota bacterium]MBU1733935.1 phosphatidylserine decarboxylase family protein [Verrucomicrobiota bacterium]MBU1857289.1 phosphatidylserine decarboxylase family protein [Verrucomicrobiota bacterium]
MPIRLEVIPFIVAVALVFGLLALILYRRNCRRWCLLGCCAAPAVVCAAYFLFFFRDPERTPPADAEAIVAGADGRVMSVTSMKEDAFLKTDCVRISIFLSLFDVHVNRAPFAGQSAFLGYFPGKHLFTFQEKSSDVNQHNKILITGAGTRCLVNQIVGPVCRRVVYWPDHDKAVSVAMGERIGMMKFGSRLDMYLPVSDVQILIKPGDTVRAGETIVARFKNQTGQF